jgi:hypothetical protein
MKKAFCFDLTSNADEAPFDDPTQPIGTDYNTLYNGTPTLMMSDYQTPQDAYYSTKGKINFAVFRTIRLDPTDISDIVDDIIEYCSSKDSKYTYKYVGPYEMFDLIKQSGLGDVIEPIE